MKLIYPLVLGSGSPRRRELLLGAGYDFEVVISQVSEEFPNTILPQNVAEYLAYKKYMALRETCAGKIVLTADTVVLYENTILGKPQNFVEAKEMLKLLSGRKHSVITGVCIGHLDEYQTFSDTTEVHFLALSDTFMDSYIRTYKPTDKAGAYGIQDPIGFIGIDKIVGSYYNVMGLPIHLVHRHLTAYEVTYNGTKKI